MRCGLFVRILFFPTSERKKPSGRARVVCCKIHFAMHSTYLAIRQNANTFCPRGAALNPEKFGRKACPLSGIFVCRNEIKIRHKYPAYVSCRKVIGLNNTLYINRYRQCRTEATTSRKDGAGIKKKAFICRKSAIHRLIETDKQPYIKREVNMKMRKNIHRSAEHNHRRYLPALAGCMVSGNVPIIVPTKGGRNVVVSQRKYGATYGWLYVPP